MTPLAVVVVIAVAIWLAAILFVARMRKKPGLRRRKPDPNYEGPARRCTDHPKDDKDPIK